MDDKLFVVTSNNHKKQALIVLQKQQPPKSRKRADFRGIYDDIYFVFLQKGIAIPYYTEPRFKNSYLQKL